MDKGRTDQAYRKARALVLAGRPCCARCHEPIDWDAPPRTRWAPSANHVVPLSRGGSPCDPSNLEPMHVGCNSSLGDGTRRRRRVITPPGSRDWL